ncbi:hypothetical protein F511_39292 [Dorcoceras hygrometricum]|uniref:Ubiquitin-like protease family profile domain-containing protein n=1 Tax=Dorcoceras hygrometricum TaxID=472368 RepID=A0A2Z7BWX9_9LAMI|nr:hypothetical protein F511_39292 [Dorcoceras hygrometricum]
MVKRKAIEAVEIELQERTFGNNRVYFPAIPKEDGFRRRHFRGMSTVTLVDLRARIDEYQEEAGVDEVDQEKIKLASLYFASAVLGPRRKRKKEVVDPDWMRLGGDINSFNTYPWGRLAYEEVLFDLRKDLRARFEEFTTLAKKRKRDPNFSGFGSLHLSGFVQPLQILTYEIYNGVAETFATRREDADVSLPRMCHWVTRKWHKNHAPSYSDVVAEFSSSSCEVRRVWDAYSDLCGVVVWHYISGDFVVSNECAVTRRMSELMSRGLKVVCSQRCLSPSHDRPSHDSPPPQTPPQTPPHQTPHHASPSRLQRLEERMTVLEAQMAMMMQEQANMMDILKILQSDMLSFKRAQSPVITTGGETAERAETWTGSPEVAGWTKEARMSQLTPVQEEESGSRESTPEAEGAQVEGNQTEDQQSRSLKLGAQVEGNQTEDQQSRSLKLGAQVNQTEGSTKSIPETEGAQVEGNQTEDQQSRSLKLGAQVEGNQTEDQQSRSLKLGAQVEGNQTEGSTKSIPDLHAFVALPLERRMEIIIKRSWARTEREIEHLSDGEKKRCFIADYQKRFFVEMATPGTWVFTEVPYCFNGHWVLVRIVPQVKILSILDSDHSVDSNGKTLLECVTPLARMMPHILVAMGVQTDTYTQWKIVQPKEYPKQSRSGECGVYAIAAATFTLADRDVYTLNDAIVADFRKFFTCCLWDQSWLLD